MKMKGIVVGAILLLATYIAVAQQDPQQPERTRGQAQQPQPAQAAPSLSQETVPQAQQQQSRERERTRLPMEQQPQLQQEPGQPPQGRRGPAPEEKNSVTRHSAKIGGQQINYTATAATYVIKADDGAPKATMFYVAYTKDGVGDISRRPISFVYNGGPGSPSLFTHMGMGPRGVVLTSHGHGMPAPYEVIDNEDSFLDATDLVFVDAISTGYGRPAPGVNTRPHCKREAASLRPNIRKLSRTWPTLPRFHPSTLSRPTCASALSAGSRNWSGTSGAPSDAWIPALKAWTWMPPENAMNTIP